MCRIFNIYEGTPFLGYHMIELYKKESRYWLLVENSWFKRLEKQSVAFTIGKEEVEELAEILYPATKWKKEYRDRNMLDGHECKLQSSINSCQVDAYCYAQYPDDYQEVIRQIFTWVNQKIKKHKRDWTEKVLIVPEENMTF